ncbi:hypothetical protein Q0590_23680 [Rhodocytophaga aerolata]|uniref:RHS repeat protein n=1 Tax=Rhodocytophaga aerolata TaxID=455078 RepID=A0ABT8RB11_9BACT|nr:hypothetical protein [Rhodocytophaga aerolata]MDO1449298.1 hypothetical protein [Rhodocytophaga aerolata]
MNIFTKHSLQLLFSAGIALGSITLTTSCSKDEQAVTPANTPSCLLTQIGYGNESQLLAYDSKNRVSKVTHEEGYAILEYDNNNRVVKILSYEDTQVEESGVIEYNAKGQWIKMTSSEPGSSATQVSTAEYDSNGNRTKVTTSYGIITYEYAGGNLTKSTTSYTAGSSTYSNTTTYEYYLDRDNKLSAIEELLNTGYGATPSKNMLKKQTYTSSYASDDSAESGEIFTYEFNEKGFPTRSTSTSTGDINGDGIVDANDVDIDETTYSYQCK